MKLFAPAKINFGLGVLGLRADGYHELHSLMVPISVGDELDIERSGQLSLVVRGANLPEDSENLVYRAAQAYLDAAGVWEGARIALHKALPLASGLGGGSSDAACTLMALARLYPANVNLMELARRLGADVPFFLVGRAAVASGIGERLTPLAFPRLSLVLANPGVEVSARDAYHWLDAEEGFSPPLDVNAVLTALAEGRPVPYFNALQPPVMARRPQVAQALSALSDAGLHSPLMSGSGATCFALARSPEEAAQAAQQIAARFPTWWVRAAQTLGG